jgi:hypothetical protein
MWLKNAGFKEINRPHLLAVSEETAAAADRNFKIRIKGGYSLLLE